MDSKQIREFSNVDECVKHFLKQGYGIKQIVMLFSKEHTIVVGKYSINVAQIKHLKKKERAQYLRDLMPTIFENKQWIDRFELEFSKWKK